jgi:hypothetical protein
MVCTIPGDWSSDVCSSDLLRAAGYTAPFSSLEEGVGDYVANYLVKKQLY